MFLIGFKNVASCVVCIEQCTYCFYLLFAQKMRNDTENCMVHRCADKANRYNCQNLGSLVPTIKLVLICIMDMAHSHGLRYSWCFFRIFTIFVAVTFELCEFGCCCFVLCFFVRRGICI